MIKIEKIKIGMEEDLWKVHHSAVRFGCKNDYSEKQLDKWVPNKYQPLLWNERIRKINPFVAFEGSTIVGYADIQANGYIDHFFVHDIVMQIPR